MEQASNAGLAGPATQVTMDSIRINQLNHRDLLHSADALATGILEHLEGQPDAKECQETPSAPAPRGLVLQMSQQLDENISTSHRLVSKLEAIVRLLGVS